MAALWRPPPSQSNPQPRKLGSYNSSCAVNKLTSALSVTWFSMGPESAKCFAVVLVTLLRLTHVSCLTWHLLIDSFIQSLTQSVTYSLVCSLTHSLASSITHSFTYSFTHSRTDSRIHLLIHSLTHSLAHRRGPKK